MTRYELLERIGVGGMAEIFRGRAIAGGGFEKPVAIKRILPRLSQDERFVKLLITEANTLSQLRHRNIVQIFDVGLGDDGQYFLVMEFVDGTDLGALYEALEKRGKRLPAHLTLHIAAELCDALDFAHRATGSDGEALRLVHRDVSPSNVLLSTAGEVKLTDFGIAKRVEEATGHHGVRGKFAYISPEQAHNATVDARSDVFSLGIVLLELATGRRALSALPDFDALHAVRAADLPRPRQLDPSMSVELEAIILKALERDPARRYQTAAAFGTALREHRYSTLTTAGDPAKEIARILEIARHEADDEPTREPTVLRIHTAAGFTGVDLAQRLLSDGGFDEEETRALTDDQIRKLSHDRQDSGRLPLRYANEPTQDISIEDLLEMAPLADAETTLLDTRARAPSMAATPNLAAVTPEPAESAARHSIEPAASAHARMATPTIRETFHSGALLDRSDPSYSRLDTEYVARYDDRAAKRRVFVVTFAAVALALAAFVVAGTLLSGDDADMSGAAVTVDGGVGEPTVELPADEIETLADAGASDAATPPRAKATPPRKKKPRRKPSSKAKKKSKSKKR